MVEETIREIRETEKQADEIIRNAEAKGEELRGEAEKQAAVLKEEILGRPGKTLRL